MDMSALGAQGYMETVCYNCSTWGECQGSNMEDCQRRDDEEKRKQNIYADESEHGYSQFE